ncbi:MAG: hypothetical protein P4L85_12085 [Paludisphaera borealis]|uniref:hypothetical protein n=1 Tax=Paludisphaera borealis TaxID=1387353 RepID=UPI002846F741|nr:hypothetical protein [Paludisphaera borealis]MDR3620082.1 hypothetical protein [Paludisphaera borealis]
MSVSRTNRSRSSLRAFRPTLDARLEDRVVLSAVSLRQYLNISQRLLKNPSPKPARVVNFPQFTKNAPGISQNPRVIHAAAVQTVRGGQAVNVVAVDGTHYRIQLAYISNTAQTSAAEGQAGAYAQGSGTLALQTAQPTETPQPQGTVRVYPKADGSVGIIVDGSTSNTELTINPLPQAIRKGYAHSFAYAQANKNNALQVSQVTINSGNIGAIEGFHTADLTGPITAMGTQAIDRIAFRSIKPGASITTGGDVNTLDVLQGITLSGTSINIGRDLNLLNVGQSITLSNGANFNIVRDVGLVSQAPKGTGTGSNVLSLNATVVGTTSTATFPTVGAYILGSLVIDTSSKFLVGRAVDQVIYIGGDLTGFDNLRIEASNVPPPNPLFPDIPGNPLQVIGKQTP